MKLGIPFICFLLLLSCKKPANRSCYKFTGKQVVEYHSLPEFERLRLGPRMEFELVQDTFYAIEIEGGENLVSFIEFTVSDKTLTLRNTNKCNFLRDQKKPVKVIIHSPLLTNIYFQGSERLSCRNQLKTNYFVLTVNDGSGSAQLNLDAIHVDADITHGWGDYTLVGKTKSAFIGARSNGFCDTRELLIADSLSIGQESQGTISVRADGIPVKGYIKTDGNVYCKGIPSSIALIRTGAGQFVQQ